MGGRGTFAAGNNVAYTYQTIDKIEGVKVLEGINGKHGLPESAHSSTAYIKLDHNGVFKEMRFYDKNHVLYLEIGYHAEESLTGNRHTPILHYHTYDPLFSKTKEKGKIRSDAIKLPGGMKKKLRKYFKGGKDVINGNPRDFIDTIYSGQDIPYRFHNKKFWFQGYNKDDGFFMEIYHCEPPYEDTWTYFGADSGECGDAFQKAPIFDGKTFWEAEQEIEWLDE